MHCKHYTVLLSGTLGFAVKHKTNKSMGCFYYTLEYPHDMHCVVEFFGAKYVYTLD